MKNPFKTEKYSRGSGSKAGSQVEAIGVEQEAIPGLSDLYFPEEGTEEIAGSATGVTEDGASLRDIAEVLRESGVISQEQYGQIRRQQKQESGVDIERVIKEKFAVGST